VIRIAAVAALALAAASPALAFEQVSAPAPKGDNARLAGFTNIGQVMRLAPAGASDNSRFFSEVRPRGPMVVYELPKDVKPASNIDVNDPRDNPFMAQPERKSAPGQ
jgi:hypothetical protein